MSLRNGLRVVSSQLPFGSEQAPCPGSLIRGFIMTPKVEADQHGQGCRPAPQVCLIIHSLRYIFKMFDFNCIIWFCNIQYLPTPLLLLHQFYYY